MESPLCESWVVHEFNLDLDLESSIAGWWLTYPSEKYESVGVMTFPYMMGEKKIMFQTTKPVVDLPIPYKSPFSHGFSHGFAMGFPYVPVTTNQIVISLPGAMACSLSAKAALFSGSWGPDLKRMLRMVTAKGHF